MKRIKENVVPVVAKPQIAELEALLDRDEEVEILPNGEVRVKGSRKPLTFRKNLGGEYAMVHV